MRALTLTTRFREGAFEGDACLLVYDAISLSGSYIGDDVREVLDRRPNTPRIFVLAPFLPLAETIESLKAGVALQRAGAVVFSAEELSVIGLRAGADGNCYAFSRTYSVADGVIVEGEERPLHDELRSGWLFDMFDSNRGRVDAPPGVHFGKASDKHAEKFLRTSNVLLSTAACAAIGFFALAVTRAREPRRIFVDTAPLLAVAFAMERVAASNGLWEHVPPARSFSSYGGVDELPKLARSDLALVSASTSGGLARRLVAMGIEDESLITLYLLKSSLETSSPGKTLCDLTYAAGRTFGYPFIQNYTAAGCLLCAKGYVLAELEGDQFLLERRGVKRLRIVGASQPRDARQAAEFLARRGALSVRLHEQDTRRTDVTLDTGPLLRENTQLAMDFRRLLRRFAPVPLHYVVLVGFSREAFDNIALQAQIETIYTGAKVVLADAVGQLEPIDDGNALVAVDCLSDHALLRGINAQLRTKVRGGCVAYLAAVTVADSPRNLADLRIFLSYGERGPETFVFRSAMALMLPWAAEQSSPWVQELQLLSRLASEGVLPSVLLDRRARLEALSSTSDELFLAGLNGRLKIAPDFVFLDTKQGIELISQADTYAVVSNLLATARCDNRGLADQAGRGVVEPTWMQSVYGQVLLCPSNFRDFNDAVLRASMLRSARVAELNYSVDDQCSKELLDVILTEVGAWSRAHGEALPEFLVSMACGRLRLMRRHVERLKAEVASREDLPPHLKLLGRVIPDE